MCVGGGGRGGSRKGGLGGHSRNKGWSRGGTAGISAYATKGLRGHRQ